MVLLSLAALVFVALRFSVHTELAALIPADEPWRMHEHVFERAFVEQSDDITLVIDGRTPELADAAAARLQAALAPRTDLFVSVERLNGGPFFEREGILFLPEAEVRATTEALIKAQPLLAPVASDPSLRGVLTSLRTGAEAVAANQASPDQIAGPLHAIGDTVGKVESGQPAWFAWRPLITGHALEPGDGRQFVELITKLDYADADPGEVGVAAVRATAARLGVDAAHGLRLRVTGTAAMEADELATLGEATGPLALVTLLIALGVLYLAVRSPRMVAAIVATVFAGLALTAAFGLAVFHRFNLISVAFLPLFVGLGIDFAIQFCVRYRAEALDEPDIPAALAKAGAAAGPGLTLAAGATGLGFLAFLPTRYKGVSELGLIAGVGMGIAFLLALTFLPALLTLIRARSPAQEVGLPPLRRADGPLQARRWMVLGVAVVLGLSAAAAVPRLKFNFDPLRLRSPKTESVATFLELAREPENNPNSLDILTPNLGEARALAAQLAKLPHVQSVSTVDNLSPPDQPPKLALVQDAALLLDPTVNPFDSLPPPSDADLMGSLRSTAASLRGLGAAPSAATLKSDALRLADLFDKAASGSPALRAGIQAVLTAGLPDALNQVRATLTAQPMSVETLPADLKEDWITEEGRARVQVFPKGDHADAKAVAAFVSEVRNLAPNAIGTPVAVGDTQRLILGAFAQAMLLSVVAITLLLVVALRSLWAVVLTIVPVLLSALLTVGSCVLFRLDINLENLITLPLLLGVGVSFNIYYVVAWFGGERRLLRSSLTRAILYSALTTGLAFGALGLSQHPGTASMGKLLLISLFWTMLTCLVVQPALLGVAGRGRLSSPSPPG